MAKKYKDEKVQIIDKDKRVHMAHIDIHYGYSVNGVAAIHTEILKQSELNHFTRFTLKSSTTRPTVSPSADGCCPVTMSWLRS